MENPPASTAVTPKTIAGDPTTANAETFAQARLLFWPFQRLETRRVNNGRLPAELGTRDSHCEARRIFLLKSIFNLV
jgi:hypothetical protein